MNMRTATLKPDQLNALQQHIQHAAQQLSQPTGEQDESEVGHRSTWVTSMIPFPES